MSFFSTSGMLEHGAQLVAPGVDQRRRRLGRGEEDVPAQDLERGIAELGAGRDVGRRRRALRARGEQHLHLAGAMMLQEVGDAAAARRDVAALQVGDQRRRAAIGHRLERDADRLAGHDAEEMRERAHRRRAEAVRASDSSSAIRCIPAACRRRWWARRRRRSAPCRPA